MTVRTPVRFAAALLACLLLLAGLFRAVLFVFEEDPEEAPYASLPLPVVEAGPEPREVPRPAPVAWCNPGRTAFPPPGSASWPVAVPRVVYGNGPLAQGAVVTVRPPAPAALHPARRVLFGFGRR